ncbi:MULTISPECIES: long-chain fatty acid--CoA ligase [unclassified Nocardiopsis]|uniref:AMP-dependent synthetase/ligase n=1 Tax=unclassified Nocardiopsis TaxID=2649073 RepID=UPI00066A8332|nr:MULTISPECIES: long-chain fatty acid--CoA ligase [unclassified Nocardiopsis]MBQ1084382.1 long-chain fatty acid--CoA ligase [Nocardiopsis sp. B62]
MREYSSPAKAEISDDARLTDTLFARAASEPNAVAARRQEEAGAGQWRDVTVEQLHGDIVGYAKALIHAGIGQGDRVALMSRTRYEWTAVDYAVWSVGAVTVPIYETSSAEQIEWILSDSGAKAAFVETEDHAKRVEGIRATTPELAHLWRFDGDDLTTLTATGTDVSDEDLETRRTAVGADDLATLIYTSGTTGRPKGCELTHRNFLFIARSALEGPAKPIILDHEGVPSTLLFLPLAHVFARFVQVMVIEGKAVLGHYPSTGPDLIDQFSVFRPTFLLAVPRVFEKVFTKAQQKAEGEGKGKIFNAAADTAIEYSKALATGNVPFTLKLKHGLFKKLVYGKITARLGGEANYAVSGGSALGDRLGHFFRGVGLTIVEGYGLTETTAPTSVNSPGFNKIGTVGQPMPGTTVRIADDGEILLKGDHIMVGYWQNEKATKEAYEDGFYRTGDLGSLDADGFLSITGRKKEIIVTAGGKNVAPAVLEDRIRSHALVSQCMVVGDNRKFIAALVTIDPESFELWKTSNNKTGEIADLTGDADLIAAIQGAVDDANNAVSKAEGIKKFRILPSDFTEEDGQMTASLKVKRHVVSKQWSKEIDDIYAG